MFRINKLLTVSMLFLAFAFTMSCNKKTASPTTGWNYNDPKSGGFEVAKSKEQITAPGLIAIEGGTFVMGGTYEDLMYDWNNPPRTGDSFILLHGSDRSEQCSLSGVVSTGSTGFLVRIILQLYKKHCPIHLSGAIDWLTMSLLLRFIFVILLITTIRLWVSAGFRPMIIPTGVLIG